MLAHDPSTSALPPPSIDATAPSATTLAAARRTRTVAVVAMVTLMVLGLAWELLIAPTGARSLALKVLPLAALLPGVARMRLSSYRMTSLVVWLYALEGTLRAVSDHGVSAALASVELALALVLFGACVQHVRARIGPRRKKEAAR